ncbi:LCP family glycopolymer transferase [Cellulomonas carbonis]|uniref:Phosphotyrosine protein phosphatase I domain-containing protein n=1 Tax=Cellulomonas carbonis T26 TaxID=947969 RepID=A0A0A0BWQ9_9CELL|nr:LCP family protein [Cellulomonas carbonis]KGM12808.1 hypothetical protein N868_00035 [Cellulomonas carbonis T26]GGC13734.1 hypothetical protein GCM10010972_28840 [Cellulomonas carbonis]
MHPTPGVPPTTAPPVRPFAVLVVGSTNTCRSPAVERFLRARLADDGVLVSSAATSLPPDEPVPEPVAALLAQLDDDAPPHEPRLVDPESVRRADLVLAVDREQRAAAVRLAPGALRRTFTVRELARVARFLGPGALPDGDVRARMAALVSAAEPYRGPTAPDDLADDDLLDPDGLDERAWARSLADARAAVDEITRTVAPGPLAEEAPVLLVPPRAPAVRPRRRARAVALVVVAALGVLVIAVTAGAAVLLDRIDDRIERFPDPFAGLTARPEAPPVEEGDEQAVTVLVLGSTGGASADPSQWAAAAAETDVVMLARIAADRGSAQLVTMPPDLWVDVPGSGQTALRSALGSGGPSAAVRTVEALTDVRVDHVALTDAQTFADVTDALGGVDLDVEADVVVNGRVVVGAGPQRLGGTQALAWAGTTTDPAVRAEHQQLWLRAILDRLTDPDTRQDPTRWLRLLGVVSGSVAVDEGLDRGTLVGLLGSLRGMGPDDVDVVAAPTTTGTTGAGSPVLVPDPEPFAALMEALRTDTLGEHLDAPDGQLSEGSSG